MKSAIGVVAATVAGALIAWVFIRHGAVGWWIVGALGVILVLAEGILRISTAGLTGTNACSRMGRIGWAAAVSILAVAVLAAAGAVYLGADVIGFAAPANASDAEKAQVASENKALAAGLGAIAAALITVAVDSLKEGPVGARVRRAYAKKFPNHRVLADTFKHHWATFESRTNVCKQFVPSEVGVRGTERKED